MKKEVEVKVRVESLDGFMAKLTEQGFEIGESIRQDDMLFINYEGDFLAFPEGANYLRIRQQKKGEGDAAVEKSFFTLKRGEEMATIERETEIANPASMRDALLYMGYREVVRVIKARRKAKHGEYEICIDDVEGLGKFIEVEKMTEQDPAVAQAELLALLETFGVDIKERVMNGYDTLMYKKLNGIA